MIKPVIIVISLFLITLTILIILLTGILKPTGIAVIYWQAPIKFDDFSLLKSSEIENYRIQWSNKDLTNHGAITVPRNIFSYRITELTAEKYDISVTANSIYGTQSKEAKTSIMIK